MQHDKSRKSRTLWAMTVLLMRNLERTERFHIVHENGATPVTRTNIQSSQQQCAQWTMETTAWSERRTKL